MKAVTHLMVTLLSQMIKHKTLDDNIPIPDDNTYPLDDNNLVPDNNTFPQMIPSQMITIALRW